MTFSDYDPNWYAGNFDPLRTATTDPQITVPEGQLLQLINQHRVTLGLSALVEDLAMTEVMRAHLKHMEFHAPPFYTSDSPELTPPSWDPLTPPVNFWDRMVWNSIVFPIGAGETLASGGGMTPGEALISMLNSPAYQAIIEDPLWTSIGVGHWTGGSQGNLYGCLFK